MRVVRSLYFPHVCQRPANPNQLKLRQRRFWVAVFLLLPIRPIWKLFTHQCLSKNAEKSLATFNMDMLPSTLLNRRRSFQKAELDLEGHRGKAGRDTTAPLPRQDMLPTLRLPVCLACHDSGQLWDRHRSSTPRRAQQKKSASCKARTY